VKLHIKINSIKGLKSIIKNEDQIKKKIYIANWDGRMKLNINKTSIKEPRIKIRIKNNKD
jgi:hypothetical protein